MFSTKIEADKSRVIDGLPKVLVLDDEEKILSSLRRQLRGVFEVFTCSNPLEALRVVSSGQEFEVVVCDQQMPAMSGTEFLKRLDVISPTTVRIMLTGNSDQQTPVEAMNDATVFRFLNKPCPATNLIVTINEGVAEYHRRALLYSAADRADSAEIVRAEILANVSHELRTPLNHILGFAELVRSTETGLAECKEFAEIIHGSGEKLLREINNVLDLATIRSGAMPVTRSTVTCVSLVEFARSYIEQHYGDRDIRFKCATYGNFRSLEIDEGLFKTAIAALLTNAAIFNPNGTTVYLAARSDDSGRPVIEISDDGVGIAEAMRSDIFNTFTQVDGSLSRKVDGCGIGLPLARDIVELHDGFLELESEVDCGTVIRIVLPRIAADYAGEPISFDRFVASI